MYGRTEWKALASAAQSLMCVAQTAAAAGDIEGWVKLRTSKGKLLLEKEPLEEAKLQIAEHVAAVKPRFAVWVDITLQHESA